MLAFIAYLVGLLFSLLQALDEDTVDTKPWWAWAILFAGLALSQLPYGPRWPRNTP